MILAALLAGACGSPSPSTPSPPASSPTISSPGAGTPSGTSPSQPPPSSREFARVVVLVMENKDLEQVIGVPDAPYINSLARTYALALNYRAITHPSLPNYLALLGGSTFGIRSNCTDCHVNAPSLVDGLERAGISWKAYMEGLPSPCSADTTAGRYAKKHDPFMYFDGIVKDVDRCSRVVPLGQLDRDVTGGTLPRFMWITPDLCHDMHDCPVAEGDAFLKGLIPRLLPTLGRNGVLFLTWDESTSHTGQDGGRVATIVAGPTVRPGFRSTVRYTHYSLLTTIVESWGLPRLVRSCACTLSMRAFFGPAG